MDLTAENLARALWLAKGYRIELWDDTPSGWKGYMVSEKRAFTELAERVLKELENANQ